MTKQWKTFFQEIYSSNEQERCWENQWGNKILFSYGSNHSIWVVILVSKSLKLSTEKYYSSGDSQILQWKQNKNKTLCKHCKHLCLKYRISTEALFLDTCRLKSTQEGHWLYWSGLEDTHEQGVGFIVHKNTKLCHDLLPNFKQTHYHPSEG